MLYVPSTDRLVACIGDCHDLRSHIFVNVAVHGGQ